VQRYGIKLGASRNFSEKNEVFGYFDVGERIWDRGEDEIKEGVNFIHERYYWTYLGIGGGINYEIIPKLSAGLNLEWMFTTIKPRMRVKAGGNTYNLGRTFGAEIQVPIKYRLLNHLSLDLTPFFTYWQIAKSDPIPIASMPGWVTYEPDSTTHIQGIRAGLTYDF
jgi:hypothetical protein